MGELEVLIRIHILLELMEDMVVEAVGQTIQELAAAAAASMAAAAATTTLEVVNGVQGEEEALLMQELIQIM
ncbi:hypothetical protein GCM10023183_32470 [Nibribacter koreensis]|uniref:Uncharacterized protein n=1 Tax=Nibribacter koreensis TaxID=1084519 RepID=A0ABP8FXN9_9BACT